MFAQVRLISIAALVTLLIWVAADQSLITSGQLRVSLEFIAAGETGMSISTIPPTLQPVHVQVTGPREAVDTLRNEVVKVTIPLKDRRAGEYEINLLDELRANAHRLMNLSIEHVNPERIDVQVDRTVRQRLPIRVDPGGVAYDVAPTVEPDHVDVLIAESAWNLLRERSTELYVELEAERFVGGWPQGQLLRREVPLIDPTVAGVAVDVSPDTVTLSCNIREQHKTAVVKAVPIRFEAQIDIFNEFIIERRSDDTLLTQAITVRGPPDLVEKLASGELRVSGVIQFTTNDTVDTADFRYYTPKFHLPPGVELIEKPSDIELRLARRTLSPAN